MKNINPTNSSEKQVVEHLLFLIDEIILMYALNKNVFYLRPQGMNTIIEKAGINLMEVKVNEHLYTFGGITEKFYDDVVEYFSDLES